MHASDKMDMKLRQFLLLLLDNLSDLDRCRLHFVIGNQIPRRLRETNSIENTIHVFEHLIDSGKIFTCLSEALLACGKSYWSEELKKFQPTSSIPVFQSSQASKTTITQLLFDDLMNEEDPS